MPRHLEEARTTGAPKETVSSEVEPPASNTPTRTEDPPSVESIGTLHPPIGELLLSLVDAYFDLDRADLRADARRVLESDAAVLKEILAQNPALTMLIEGHCDERGSAEYNLALGAKRAETAQRLLESLGIPSATLRAISYGKERPQCTVAAEECWQKNRRAHVTAQ